MLKEINANIIYKGLKATAYYFFSFLSAFADSVLSIMASLVPFLKKEDLNSMPLGLAMTLSIWPQSTHNNIIKLLAGYILPVLLGKAIARIILSNK